MLNHLFVMLPKSSSHHLKNQTKLVDFEAAQRWAAASLNGAVKHDDSYQPTVQEFHDAANVLARIGNILVLRYTGAALVVGPGAAGTKRLSTKTFSILKALTDFSAYRKKFKKQKEDGAHQLYIACKTLTRHSDPEVRELANEMLRQYDLKEVVTSRTLRKQVSALNTAYKATCPPEPVSTKAKAKAKAAVLTGV